ncbi:MAG: cupin domain-containing protein [Promethearchaeota archaeon]
MEHYHHETIPSINVTDYNSKKTTIRVLIDKNKAPHFIMRVFEIQPGGEIGLHSHEEEHEIFILNGEVMLIDEHGKKIRVSKGEFIYIPPNEPHGYENNATDPVKFICVIPKLK